MFFFLNPLLTVIEINLHFIADKIHESHYTLYCGFRLYKYSCYTYTLSSSMSKTFHKGITKGTRCDKINE